MNELYFISIIFFTLIFSFGISTYAEIDEFDISLHTILNDNDHFGISVSQIGDLNNDGVVDIAVGAYKDDDGGQDRGALYIIFLNNDGTVKSFNTIPKENNSQIDYEIFLLLGMISLFIIIPLIIIKIKFKNRESKILEK